MKLYSRIEYVWNDTRKQYARVYEDSFEYLGPVARLCGASAAQNDIEAQQQSFMTQAQTQAASVFGGASTVFNDLVSTFAPIVAAGPSQQGFSPQELANLNSEAITQTGQSYKNAKEAVGESQAAVGGGNVALPSGTQTGQDLQLAESGANQTASELGQITNANYATGLQNYQTAAAGLENASNTYNSSASLDNAATNAGNAASNTANQIASQNSSWMQLVSGALGDVTKVATDGLAGGTSSGGSSGEGTPFSGE